MNAQQQELLYEIQRLAIACQLQTGLNVTLSLQTRRNSYSWGLVVTRPHSPSEYIEAWDGAVLHEGIEFNAFGEAKLAEARDGLVSLITKHRSKAA